MKSLKDIWNRIQYENAAHDFLGITQEEQELMEKDGWEFKTYLFHTGHAISFAGSSVTVPIKTPEGEDIELGDKENYKSYQGARKDMAAKLYNITP